jgi:hypothetical protein
MRLIAGESAHAMPSHGEQAAMAQGKGTAQSQEAPCPDHAASSDASAPMADTATPAHADGSHGKDCCKNTCSCPCLHLSALLTASLNVSAAIPDQLSLPLAAIGRTPERVSLLFRPPA